jgi:hypothetical protein
MSTVPAAKSTAPTAAQQLALAGFLPGPPAHVSDTVVSIDRAAYRRMASSSASCMVISPALMASEHQHCSLVTPSARFNRCS